jgi:hypothetical protein
MATKVAAPTTAFFIKAAIGKISIIGIHVDDLIIASSSSEEL